MSAANLNDSNHMIDCQPASFVGARYIGGNLIKSLDGKSPQVHPSAFVSEAAYVIGDVEIGEGSSIWPGVVIRADMGKIKIGSNTCIQDNSVVHGDADVEIGNRVVIGLSHLFDLISWAMMSLMKLELLPWSRVAIRKLL